MGVVGELKVGVGGAGDLRVLLSMDLIMVCNC